MSVYNREKLSQKMRCFIYFVIVGTEVPTNAMETVKPSTRSYVIPS